MASGSKPPVSDSAQHPSANVAMSNVDWVVVSISVGAFVAFILAALIDLDAVGQGVSSAMSWISDVFGSFFSLLVFANAVLVGYLVLSKYGRVQLGGEKPQMHFVTWVSVMFCSAIAAGAVFFGPGEPLTHFSSPPPLFGDVESRSGAAAVVAMQYSYLHWGLSAWAIYGTFALATMVGAYHRGLPLRPSSAFFSILGEHRVRGGWGKAIDIFSVLAVVGGVMPTIGLLVIQLSYMLNSEYGIPNTSVVQFTLLAIAIAVFVVSASLGIERGIARLSRINVALAVVLGLAILIVGPTLFIFNLTTAGIGGYVQDFVSMSLFTDAVESSGWLSSWSVYYWAWWIGWGPILGLFLARISRGRTVRQIILGALMTSSLALVIWFGVLGGAGINLDLASGGEITNVLEEAGMESALLSILNGLPISQILIPGFLVVLLLFLVTTADSITMSAAIVSTGLEDPKRWIRIMWGLVIGGVAGVLLHIGGLSTFQAAAIATAPPIALMMALVMWSVPGQLRGVVDGRYPLVVPRSKGALPEEGDSKADVRDTERYAFEPTLE